MCGISSRALGPAAYKYGTYEPGSSRQAGETRNHSLATRMHNEMFWHNYVTFFPWQRIGSKIR